MKHKIFSLLSLSILALVMFMSLASATTETFDNSEATGEYLNDTFTGVDGVVWNYEEARDEGDYNISGAGIIFRDIMGKIYSNPISGGISDFSVKLSNGDSSTTDDRQVELFINSISKGTSTVFSDTNTHTFTVNDINIEGDVVIELRNILDSHVIIDDITWTGYTAPIEPEEITECCDIGDNGNLDVKIKDITNKGISGKKFGDDTEWFPLEEIELEIEVENKGDEKIKDIVVGWGLYDVENEDWIIDDEENDFNLKDGDEETLTIKFQIDDIDEFEDGNDYILYVWAVGEDEEFDGNETCVMDSESIEIIIENDFVVVDNIEVPELVQCGAEVQITADVWNIGEDNQDEVSVQIYSKELGINKMVEIGDIDALEDEKLDTLITIPKTAEGWYYLHFYVHDEDGDLYENDYDDDEAEFKVSIKVEGSCLVGPEAVVSATLESGGEAGEELVVKATITNTGDELASYVLTAEGYSEWATLLSIEPGTVVLSAGDSKQVIITLIVNDDALGDKLFNLIATSSGEEAAKQPVSVTIKESASGISGITGKVFAGEGSTYLWGIAILNIILVIIIITVAVRVAGR